MKPPKNLRPLTDIRVTRKTNVEVELGESHGWAVSYADLLMVLLSFFVLYFSFAEDNPDTVNDQLQRIALSMQGMTPKEVARVMRSRDTADMSSLAAVLKIEGIKVTQNQDHLLVELEKGIFRSADYRLQAPLRAQLDAVIGKLKPFEETLTLTVIGHTDKLPLIPRNEFLTNNFDLSSMRALSALKYIIEKGFPENRVSARAASSYDRDARSITFELRVAKPETAGESI